MTTFCSYLIQKGYIYAVCQKNKKNWFNERYSENVVRALSISCLTLCTYLVLNWYSQGTENQINFSLWVSDHSWSNIELFLTVDLNKSK